MNFEYIKNPDGAWGLYNKEIGDIYFSNIGAYKEALEKFVLPANPKSIKNKKIKILDVCYGMGYNSKTFVDYCVKNNLLFDFHIDFVENDEKILALGLLNFDKNISSNVHLYFGKEILSKIYFSQNTNLILGENWIKDFLRENMLIFDANSKEINDILFKTDDLNNILHNIYYQNHTLSNNFSLSLGISWKIKDLIADFQKLEKGYDLIFHDAFSIRKQPEMWTEQIFSRYYQILNSGGKLLTYSNSRVVRRILEGIGFIVETNFDENNKQNGTIAIKT